RYEHPFFVMLADGRVITSGSQSFPEPFLRIAKSRLERLKSAQMLLRGDGGLRGAPPPGFPESARRSASPGQFGPGDRFERAPDGVRFVRPSPIIVAGHVVGVVVVPPQAPFGFLLGRWAPTLALVAVGVLVVGSVLTSAMIFGPARRRLRALETAARQLG